MFYDVYLSLCKKNKKTPSAVAAELGINKSNVSNWKNNGYTPRGAALQKIADYFDVQTDDLLRFDFDSPMIRCRDCGADYDSSDPKQVDQHESRHLKWSKAVQKFGFCWTAIHRERVKGDARGRIEGGNLSDEEYVDVQLTVFKALFSRSLEDSGYCLDHVDFPTYVAMCLNQEQWKREIPTRIYDILAEIYGVKPGMEHGSHYFVSSNPEATYASYDAYMKSEAEKMHLTITDTNPQLDELNRNAKQLNAQGLQKLVDLSDDLVASGKYEKKPLNAGE